MYLKVGSLTQTCKYKNYLSPLVLASLCLFLVVLNDSWAVKDETTLVAGGAFDGGGKL